MALAARRLPGVVIEVVPPPPAEALPRMDVAVIVGFASTGPMHIAVPVESVAQYAAVFGPDASLAWNAEQGTSVSAYLGPAVRAFFSNGGRRCWVIRVGRTAETEQARSRFTGIAQTTEIATSNVFAVPGVLSVSADATPRVTAAIARARCEGSWSDALRVATALSRRRFSIEQVEAVGSPGADTLRFSTRFPLRVGDLLELGEATAIRTHTYARVDAVEAAPEPGGALSAVATVCAAFEALESSSPSSPADWPGTAEVYGFGAAVPATLAVHTVGAAVRFDAPVPDSLERGHWVRWTDGVARAWLRVDDIARAPAFDGSPNALGGGWMTGTVSGPAWRELPPAAFTGAFDRADLLTIELRVTGNAIAATASVGPTPNGVDSWWSRVSDAELYSPSRDGAQRVVPSTEPRFPLCRADEPLPAAWIPLGVSSLFDTVVGPLPQRGSSLERDGLAEYGAELFLDPELANAPARSIVELADAIRFLRAEGETRQLLGMHAGLSVGAGGLFNEASLLAIPDAVHLGWYSRGDDIEPSAPTLSSPSERTHRGPCGPNEDALLGPPDFGVFLECSARELGVPVLDGPSQPVPPGTFRLTWSDVEPRGEYVLLEATRADLSDEHEVARTPDAEYVVLAQREGVYFYRVFARVDNQRGDWSNVSTVRVRRDAWLSRAPEDADALMEGEWLAVHRAALRMAAATGELFAALAMPAHFRTARALRYAQRLRAVREPQGLAAADALDFTELRALSYGALYFPWLGADARRTAAEQARTRPDVRGATTVGFAPPAQPTVVPPDGAALGVLAARASRRGAWVAAANEPLRDVVALTPVVPAADWRALQDAQVNVVRDDPRGFLALSADTLSREEELRPINVRRLLTLLRRLALRRGTSYVFEPNGPTLRRAVQRGFETILTELFRRGAFAGATAATSFQVVTEGVRTAADEEAGRFVVELRVAPSSPLAFLAVRLEQTGARLSITEEL